MSGFFCLVSHLLEPARQFLAYDEGFSGGKTTRHCKCDGLERNFLVNKVAIHDALYVRLRKSLHSQHPVLLDVNQLMKQQIDGRPGDSDQDAFTKSDSRCC